jgi:nucleotide-binding universal stress UspA family protein
MARQLSVPQGVIRSEVLHMSDSAPARVFLVVVDETPEHRIAVRYAARRAAHTGGRVALLYVIEPAELQHFQAIEDLARAERREAAEELLQALCDEIAPIAGSMPIVYIREGRTRDELLQLISEEPAISILVLGAGTGAEGPGPLVTYLAGTTAARLRVPITIVPGGLSTEQVDLLS